MMSIYVCAPIPNRLEPVSGRVEIVGGTEKFDKIKTAGRTVRSEFCSGISSLE